MNYDALNPWLYTQVLDDLESVFSHKPFQILFYGSWERGQANAESDLNFYLLAHSTDQMKASFVDSVLNALKPMGKVAPVNMIAGDSESLKHRMKLFEPGCVQLLENSSVFFGESLIDSLRVEWNKIKHNSIPRKELIQYLEKRIRFFKQQTTRNLKEEVGQLERLSTLSLHVWALRTIEDLTVSELLALDIPSQAVSLCRNLYHSELDDQTNALLQIIEQIYDCKKRVRLEREITREEMHELKYRLVHIRKDEELLVDLWA